MILLFNRIRTLMDFEQVSKQLYSSPKVIIYMNISISNHTYQTGTIGRSWVHKIELFERKSVSSSIRKNDDLKL
jgi:hypothetical protein